MRKYFFSMALIFTILKLSAQSNDQAVAEKFRIFYNQQKSDSIFSLFSPMLKEKLPLEKSTDVFSGLHVQMGDLKSLSFIKQDTGFSRFKASFKDQTFTMLLALNNDGLIDGIRFVPYIKDQSAEAGTGQK
jgi:hypothetical protein